MRIVQNRKPQQWHYFLESFNHTAKLLARKNLNVLYACAVRHQVNLLGRATKELRMRTKNAFKLPYFVVTFFGYATD